MLNGAKEEAGPALGLPLNAQTTEQNASWSWSEWGSCRCLCLGHCVSVRLLCTVCGALCSAYRRYAPGNRIQTKQITRRRRGALRDICTLLTFALCKFFFSLFLCAYAFSANV